MSPRRVLFSVLDWGLGHATRSVPVIKSLLKNRHEVILAGEGRSLLFLQNEFPECKTENLNGFLVKYSEKFMTAWAIRNYPAMMKAYEAEQKQTGQLVKKYQPDVLISDHRYGFFHPEIKSILIAHQLRIQAGLFTDALFKIHKNYLLKFDQIWVPDYAGTPGLSGELSHHSSITENLAVDFIGPLSRLKDVPPVMYDRISDILVLISGPEPHRSHFENYCREFLNRNQLHGVIIRGTPEQKTEMASEFCFELPSVDASELKGLILTSRYIICRPGYSSIMDLYACGKNAILIPTPGQTEQKYLAKLHANRNFSMCNTLKGLDKAFAKHEHFIDEDAARNFGIDNLDAFIESRIH